MLNYININLYIFKCNNIITILPFWFILKTQVFQLWVNFKCLEWRPRRTMVFCSWGAEEYGLIGSYEFTEQYGKALSQRAVAYLNLDMAVSGVFFFLSYS